MFLTSDVHHSAQSAAAQGALPVGVAGAGVGLGDTDAVEAAGVIMPPLFPEPEPRAKSKPVSASDSEDPSETMSAHAFLPDASNGRQPSLPPSSQILLSVAVGRSARRFPELGLPCETLEPGASWAAAVGASCLLQPLPMPRALLRPTGTHGMALVADPACAAHTMQSCH